ncbi:YfjI family protein [Virgibacillus sp. YIM 98842]|uniref:YfjI family protein n=1 Tax=Virgibacillus sp. YIM 98842 TaxID=2663533 RepID=UPI0013DCA97C|nr:YfjI family protein [Virgibacillus sp. YIM 98842]
MNAVQELAEEQNKKAPPQEWDEPIGFDEDKLPNFDSGIFPAWIKDYVDSVAESTQTPKDAAGIAAISILSTILSRKFEVNVIGDWVETLNTYSVMALGSANRKSSVFKNFIGPVMEYEQEQAETLSIEVAKQQDWLRAKQRRIEKLEKDFAKDNDKKILEEIYSVREEIEAEEIMYIPSFITADATPEKIADLMAKNNEKIAVLSAEGAEAFQMMAGRYTKDKASNIDIYLKGHSADNVSIDRMGRESIKLHNPTLTIGLFVQPSVIKDIPDTFQERGLTQRFLYSFPRSKVGYREIEPKQVDPFVKEVFHNNMNKLLRIEAETPRQLTFDEEASRYEVYLRTEIEEMLKDEDLPDSFQGWIGKLAGQIIRIAGLLHVAEYVGKEIPSEINTDTLQRANVLREYFIQHAMKAHGVMGVNEDEETAKYLLNVIQRQQSETVEYRAIQELTNRKFKTSQDFKETLFQLEDRGFIKMDKVGRKTVYHVHPKIVNNEM